VPSISTMLYPAPGYVRVETNWADVTQATGVKVERVDCLTGERVPLRPYVSYSGDYLTLSCGYAIFWDTEPQLDRCVYYCATAIDAAGAVVTTTAAYLYSDTFTRTVVDGWGTSDSNHTYQLLGGTVPGDYDVNGSQGTFTITTNNVPREAIVIGLSEPNGILYGYYQHPVVPTGAGHEMDVRIRRVDSNNFCDLRIFFGTGNTITIAVRQVLAGVETALVGFPGVVDASGALVTTITPLNYRIDFWGSILRAKVWPATEPEPATYLATTTVTHLSAGSVAYLGTTGGGSTNVLPITLKFDNHLLSDPCADLVTIETCSDDLIVPSNGDFRLGDPVRPCNDVTLRLGEEIDPNCVPTQGIFFGHVGPDETFAAHSGTFLPTNSKYPIAVNRQRQAVTSTLAVVTRTFPDRDDLRALNDPGSPLLLRGPATYGVDDRYMSVTDVTEHRPLADHKIAPRAVDLPHIEVARPSGPTQGVCGARVDDLCDIYATWSAIEAAGLTWADLLRGKASNDTPVPDSTERTWAQVNSTYADWNAVNAGNTDWDDLLDGA